MCASNSQIHSDHNVAFLPSMDSLSQEGHLLVLFVPFVVRIGPPHLWGSNRPAKGASITVTTLRTFGSHTPNLTQPMVTKMMLFLDLLVWWVGKNCKRHISKIVNFSKWVKFTMVESGNTSYPYLKPKANSKFVPENRPNQEAGSASNQPLISRGELLVLEVFLPPLDDYTLWNEDLAPFSGIYTWKWNMAGFFRCFQAFSFRNICFKNITATKNNNNNNNNYQESNFLGWIRHDMSTSFTL